MCCSIDTSLFIFQAASVQPLRHHFRQKRRTEAPRTELPSTRRRNFKFRHSRNLVQRSLDDGRQQQDRLRVRPDRLPSSLHVLLKFHETPEDAPAGDCFWRRRDVLRQRWRLADRREASRRREEVSVRPVLQTVSDEQRFETSRRRPHRQPRVPVLLLQPQVRPQRSPHASREEDPRGRALAAAAANSGQSEDPADFVDEKFSAATPSFAPGETGDVAGSAASTGSAGRSAAAPVVTTGPDPSPAVAARADQARAALHGDDRRGPGDAESSHGRFGFHAGESTARPAEDSRAGVDVCDCNVGR